MKFLYLWLRLAGTANIAVTLPIEISCLSKADKLLHIGEAALFVLVKLTIRSYVLYS
jgi:hypothetical protein